MLAFTLSWVATVGQRSFQLMFHRTLSLLSSTPRRLGVSFFFFNFKEVFLFLFIYLFGRAACGILVPQPGMEPSPPAVEEQSLNHWTAREVPGCIL